MVLEETSRRLLHERAVLALGVEAADVLMEHLPPAGWSDLARRSDVEHEAALLRSEIGAMRVDLTAGMASLAGELRTQLQAAIAAQTRWMLTVLVVLGALYTTVNVLAR
jgi:hypothetical protein